MAVVTAAEIRDRDSFQTWLEARPETSRRAAITVMASRIALRVLPPLNRKRKLTLGQHTTLTKVEFWRFTISRSVRTWPDREIAAAFAADAAATDASATFAAAFVAATAAANAADAASTTAAAAAAFASAAYATYATDASAADAAADAAAYATFAFAFADAAAAATWEYIRSDAAVIEAGEDPFTLFAMPLWQEAPPWWREEWQAFKTTLTAPDMAEGEWAVWIAWYETVTQGQPAFNLKNRQTADALERRIALGDRDKSGKFNKEFWTREPGEINLEIAQWVAEARAAEAVGDPQAKPIFISYTAQDLEAAKRIGDVVESGGYTVFAQYKDMPPGSNFVTRMQVGLADMGKFVPIYSPAYLLSDHCQAEWNAAYNIDPLGKRQLIVGFLLKKAELLPLQRQNVYVPLYGLTAEQAKKAILQALSDAGAKRTPIESRHAATRYAIPAAEVTAEGVLTFVPAEEIEQPFIDDEIARLPKSMLKVLATLMAATTFTSNMPPILQPLLRSLQSELAMGGSMAHVPDLERDILMIKAERASAVASGAPWQEGAFGAGLDEMFKLFEAYKQHFPLVMLRDIEKRQAAIDPAKFDARGFARSHGNLSKAVGALLAEGKADETVRHITDLRQQQRENIEQLTRYAPKSSDRFIPSADERSIDDLKTDFMFDEGGTWDRMLDRTEKVSSIADSTAGKVVISAAKEFLKAIWGG